MNSEERSVSLKIVTVDDSPIIVERLKAMLNEMNNVEFAGNATTISSALALISQQKPNVVILDIHLEADMPAANGISLLTILRKRGTAMKIIMLTNLNEPQYRNTCLFMGANYFLDKSNEFEKLPETLLEIIQAETAHQALNRYEQQ